MGWNEFWDWKFSDSDESFYEHLEKEYGEDAPVLHAILDTAVDTVVGAIPVAGQVYTVANARNPEIKEAKDAIWEDRHEILAVGSAVPIVGTAVSAIDATLHAAESVENNVEFFIEGATGEDEPIYDENGNLIGWKDKWMTDKMQRKKKNAVSHGANATLGAVMTMTGANYAKGGKAAVTAAQKSGGYLEKIFTKQVSNATKKATEEEAKRAAAQTAREAAEKKGTKGAIDKVTADAAYEARAKAGSEAKTAVETSESAAEAAKKKAVADEAAKKAAEKRAAADEAAKKAAEDPTKRSLRKDASRKAQDASNAEGHAAALEKKATEAQNAVDKAAADAERSAIQNADQAAKEAGEAAARKAEKTAAREAEEAAAKEAAAASAKAAAEQTAARGIRVIDALRASNNIRTFLATSVTIGLATVSEYNKNIDRKGLSDDYKAPAIPYIND